MQPKIIELKQAPVVLVELEERPTKVEDSFANGFIYTDEKGYVESFYLDDICEDSKLVGVLSGLTEEQFAGCVDSWDSVWNDGSKVYENYKESVPKKTTAKKSFYSLLESENVYTENPYKHPDDIYTNRDDSNIFQKLSTRKWQEAQSRTIDPTRTVVLLRKEEQDE